MEFAGESFKIEIWEASKCFPGVEEIVVDTETTMVPFTETPELVTLQAYAGGDTAYFVRKEDIQQFLDAVKNRTLVFHNAPFDIDVIEKAIGRHNYLLPWIDVSQIKDTQIMWKLIHLAVEGYVPRRSALKFLMQHIFNIELEKEGDVRCNFEQFLGKPLEDIPMEFAEYAIKDVLATWKLFKRLKIEIGTIGNSQELSLPIQVAGSLALNRIYKRGIGFDLHKAEEMLSRTEKRLGKIGDKLRVFGWARGIPGSNEAYERIIKWLGIDLPKTDSGAVSSKEEDLLPFKEEHEFIKGYLDYHALEKTRSFISNIKTERVHPRYNVLMNTGRTSCTGSKEGACNIQQLPRDGEIRSMFVPKKDHSFIITDYTAIELSALAQVTYSMFGQSKMRELINQGRDLHKYAASQIYNIEEKDVTKEQRLLAKILNFGLGANMSHKTFVDYAKQFGVFLSEEEALNLKTQWANIFPEMKRYWDVKIPFGGNIDHATLTGRVRASCTYTAYLNTGFQGLAADGAKLALFYLEKAGINTVAFVHDEVVSEVPDNQIDELLNQQEEIMIKAMRQVIPDVEVRVESEVSKHYKK
jgi:DNA polymerase I-like protein with 3'-5' exonuclease and polymerase domains